MYAVDVLWYNGLMNLWELPKDYLATIKARIESRYEITENGCWEWTGWRFPYGYGSIAIKSKARGAHRVYYQLVNGFIDNELVIDHLCENPPCINPDHLEPVTIGENTLRGVNISATNKRKTHCLRGHEFNENNITWRGDARICRACNRVRCARRDKERTLEYHAKGLGAKGKPLKRKVDYRFQ